MQNIHYTPTGSMKKHEMKCRGRQNMEAESTVMKIGSEKLRKGK